ncbi:MAG: serine protease [Lachnospiraceae bacterium]|nr:serine protease [Lachnospiraceae bacterium]
MTPDMNDNKEQEYAFVKERIIIEKEPKKGGIVKRILLALVSGLIFAVTVLVVWILAFPYLKEHFLLPESSMETATSDDRVTIPLDDENESSTLPEEPTTPNDEPTTDGTTGEGVTTDTSDEPTEVGQQGLSEEDVRNLIDEALAQKNYTTADYMALYATLSGVVAKANKSIVEVTIVETEVDILEHSYEVTESISGIIYDITENNIYILTDYSKVKNAEAIRVTFYGGVEYEVELMKADESSDMAVICIEKEDVDNNTLSKIQAIELGNSYAVKTGDPIIAMGNPMGSIYTMSYGIVTATTHSYMKETDAHFRMIDTNIIKAVNGTGFLINLEGALVGVICEESEENGIEVCTALTISDLKKRLEKISNNEDIAYFGILGEDVSAQGGTADLRGIYVLQTDIGSPAYDSGIQNGDIIVAVADMDNITMKSLRNFLENSMAGEVVPVKVMRQGKDGYKEMKFEVIIEAK